MLILPAIDLRGGQCVRLRQGDYQQETVFDRDPVAVASKWKEQGTTFLHLVDLDGAREGKPVNLEVVAGIVKATQISCQLGGGIRDEASIQAALDMGVTRVILGTRAVREPEWLAAMAKKFPGQVVLGLDAKDGKAAVSGWHEVSSADPLSIVAATNELPLAAIVYTDISKDGMMQGPNFDATEALNKASTHPVVASGGVTTMDDVLELARRNIPATILGRSLYEGTIKLPELFAKLKELG